VLAAWYERPGPAADVLDVGEMADPEPGPREVRVRVAVSGVNPGDTKKRGDWVGYGMPYPRVIPHSDGAGVIDAVGDGVPRGRIGERVWIYGAQSYRPFGTAAQFTVVPEDHAVQLPDGVADEVGACLGIPGIAAHRAVFGDGPVEGTTVLVHGVLGGVGLMAAQLAAWGGATVIGTVRHREDLGCVDDVVEQCVALDEDDPVAALRQHAPDGVHRIVEVSFSDNADLDAALAAPDAVIAAYATRDPRPTPSGSWTA
jgi:NADPH:quinone reductase